MKIDQQTKGFTLLELMVALFIFMAITAGVTAFSVYYLRNYSFSFEENQSVGSAQTGLTSMLREIREARTGEDGSWPIIQADDTTFIFYSDTTNDGRSDRVRYFLNGTTLMKGIIQPTQPPVLYPLVDEKIYTIASNVDTSGGPIFRYYNGDWPSDQINNPLAPSNRLLNTRFVKIYLRMTMGPNSTALPFELTSGVNIRSLKNNL
jgi:prepilin-type N-terminal cleavage/methylation domain-containing protein